MIHMTHGLHSRRRLLGRRHLLRGAAGSLIALPLLEAMGCGSGERASERGEPERLRAGESPRRLIVVLTPNGTVRDSWFPTGTLDDYTLGPIMADLVAHQQHLVILEGIDNPVADTGEIDGHREGVVSLLTGWGVTPGTATNPNGGAGGMSLDQHVAHAIAGNTRRRSLELGTEAAGPTSAIAYDAYAQALPRITHPGDLFSALFGDPELDGEALANLQARRRSILDDVAGDYEQLRGRLGGDDRLRVEAHLDAVREIELRLTTQASCAAELPEYPDLYAVGELPTWTRDMIDLLVMALACDLTRVASLVYRHPGGGVSYFPWLGLGENDGVPEHHAMTHELGAWIPELTEIFRWYTAQTGYLIERLAATPELDGTLLDNVLIFQGSDCSDGSIHGKIDMPFLLAGGAGGQLETGRWLRWNHRPHNQLLVSIMNLMGIAGTCFGNPYFCDGPLPGLV
jgi:hypothetical protein